MRPDRERAASPPLYVRARRKAAIGRWWRIARTGHLGPGPISPLDLIPFSDSKRTKLGLSLSVPGACDVNVEQVAPQAQLQIVVDRQRRAQPDVRIENVRRLVGVAIGGSPVDTLNEEDRRFDVAALLDGVALASPQATQDLPRALTPSRPP